MTTEGIRDAFKNLREGEQMAGLADARDGRAFAARLAQRLAAAGHSRAAGAPVIDTYRGATFVYDAELDEYVVDPERTGAPAHGGRAGLPPGAGAVVVEGAWAAAGPGVPEAPGAAGARSRPPRTREGDRSRASPAHK